MDKRTRVLNAMDKKPVDHVPVGMWHHFSNEKYGEPCVQAHLRYYRDTDLDFLKVMNDGYIYPIPDTVQTAKDLWDLEPQGPDSPYIREQVWRVKRIVEEIGQERCVFYNIFAPFTCLRHGTGRTSYAKVMQFVKEDPLAVMHACDVIAKDQMMLAELCIREAGADGIYYVVQAGEIGRFSTEEYRRMIEPSDLCVLEHINRHSDYNILHCCGWAGAKNNLELWKDYPVKCVNWAVFVEEMPIHEGRVFFGDKAVLGGFETLHLNEQLTEYKGLLYTGTREEIQAYTRDLILFNGKRGLLLGGDCTIAAFLDEKRIRWVIEAAREL